MEKDQILINGKTLQQCFEENSDDLKRKSFNELDFEVQTKAHEYYELAQKFQNTKMHFEEIKHMKFLYDTVIFPNEITPCDIDPNMKL